MVADTAPTWDGGTKAAAGLELAHSNNTVNGNTMAFNVGSMGPFEVIVVIGVLLT